VEDNTGHIPNSISAPTVDAFDIDVGFGLNYIRPRLSHNIHMGVEVTVVCKH
jgi:hypothetical protein